MSAPLADLTVLLTRPAQQSQPWVDVLERAGARVIVHPTISIQPPPSWAELDRALGQLDRYAWVVFTSAAAARHTVSRMKDATALATADRQVAAVGNQTRLALEELGVPVALVPARQDGLGLAHGLGHLAPGTRILFPQALNGRTDFTTALTAQGCVVDVVAASQTVPIDRGSPGSPPPPLPPFDAVVFASPSALHAFVAAYATPALAHKIVIALGRSTAAAAGALGIPAHTVASPDIDAVVQQLAAQKSR